MHSHWGTAATAFAVTRRDGDWLFVRHERDGQVRWEIPGGPVDAGETLEQAAARETAEETGVAVEVGRLLATCVHEWAERRQRKLVSFFDAVPVDDREPRAPEGEPAIVLADWRDPMVLEPDSVSAFLHPLVEQHRLKWRDAPIHFSLIHRRNARGLWEPGRADTPA